MKSHLSPRVPALLVLALILTAGLTFTSCRSKTNEDLDRARQEQLRKQQEEEVRKRREEEALRANSIITDGTVKKIKLAAFFNLRFGINPPYSLGFLPAEPTAGSGHLQEQPEYIYISIPRTLKGQEIDLAPADPTTSPWTIQLREGASSKEKTFGKNGESRAKKGSTLTLTVENEWINTFKVKLHLVYDDATGKTHTIDLNYLGSCAVGGGGFLPFDDLRKYKQVEPQKLAYDATYVKTAFVSKFAKGKKLTELLLLPAAPNDADYEKLTEALYIRLPENLLGTEIPLTVENTKEQAKELGWAITFIKDGEKREFMGNPLLPKLLEGSKLHVDALGGDKYRVQGTLIFPHTKNLYTLTCDYEGTFTEVPHVAKLK
nr:hypothetical protein [uncultured Porphyromonas sp.]